MKVILLSVILTLMSCGTEPEGLPFFNSAEFEPEWISPSQSQFTRIHRIAPFEFMDQEGRVVTNSDFDGRIYIADFFFTTCPSICPQMTDNMVELQEEFKEDTLIKFISHTVMPWIDTIDQLKRYAIEKGVDSQKWHLVTGEQEALYSLARESYFAEKEIGLIKGTDDFLHTENFILVDFKRRIRGIYNGTKTQDMKRLKEDVLILKKAM